MSTFILTLWPSKPFRQVTHNPLTKGHDLCYLVPNALSRIRIHLLFIITTPEPLNASGMG